MPRETAVYTHGHHESVLRAHRWRTAANSAGYLLAELQPGQDVLDVGCGPGTITTDLAALVAPGTVTGVDTSADVLEAARAAADARGVANVRFSVSDVNALDFPDDSFDVVHAHQVLQHVADPVGALQEMRRVCRPGGTVAARDADYGAFSWFPETPALARWQELYRTVARANGGQPDAGRRLLSWAGQAGFTEVICSAGTWCFATPDERAWWSGQWAERTTASGYSESAVRGGHASVGQLTEIAEAWREWGSSEDGWFLVPHGEILCRA